VARKRPRTPKQLHRLSEGYKKILTFPLSVPPPSALPVRHPPSSILHPPSSRSPRSPRSPRSLPATLNTCENSLQPLFAATRYDFASQRTLNSPTLRLLVQLSRPPQTADSFNPFFTCTRLSSTNLKDDYELTSKVPPYYSKALLNIHSLFVSSLNFQKKGTLSLGVVSSKIYFCMRITSIITTTKVIPEMPLISISAYHSL
jgi:hypothetical protein